MRPHPGENGLGDGDQPEEVDLQLPANLLVGCGFQGAQGAVAGIVDEDVDLTKST